MLKSKMIPDPTHKWSNLLGRTVGFVFYTPKYWDCQTYNFYSNQFDEMRNGRPLSEKELEERFQTKMAHRKCKRKHRSYKGYIYFIGPKRRYQLHYMGDINPYNSNSRWGYVQPHGLYVRWRDDGSRDLPYGGDHEILDSAVWAGHRRKFRDALKATQRQMEEYERVRSPDGKGWS